MPKVVDHEQYRKELLNGCIELFAQRGYGSITMRQISEGLGVSTGTLYHYFRSKEEIFKQLVQEQLEQDMSRFFAQTPKVETLEARLRAIMEFVLSGLPHYQQQMLLWVDFYQQTRTGSDEELKFLRQAWDRSRADIVDYLQLPNTGLADFLMVFIDGLIIQCVYNRGADDADWYRNQSQLMIQMVLSYEQFSA